MANFQRTAFRSTLAAFLMLGAMSAAALAGDLSRYRNFELGSDLATVAKRAAVDTAQAKVIHSRPAFIQDLEWRPQPLGASAQAESVQEVVFSFYGGELFRIKVDYDRYQTEGLTVDDFVDAISATYGPATKPTAPAKVAPYSYGDQADIVAQWQDSQYRFDLIRSAYGPAFRLVGVLKRLEAPAQAATLEAKRLDDQEAPQRDAARLASEKEAANAKLEKARLVNKPKFRP
ncbi:MAG: hypothetical protein KIT09_29625 [Bryobacteraceae bacterium]|nr:hypothetical protein [Bryobacteraceae bacterium]